MDLRLRIVRAIKRGSSYPSTARRFAVCPSGDQADATGAGDRQPRRPATAAIGVPCSSLTTPTSSSWLRHCPTSRRPSCKRNGSAAWAWSSGSQPCTTLSAASASGIKKSVEAAEQDRPDIAQKRRLGGPGNASGIRRGSSSSTRPHRTDLARRYGRSPSGARLVAAVPHGHWRATTFVAGLRQSGIVAPLVLDGPMTGSAFRAYVDQFRSAGARARRCRGPRPSRGGTRSPASARSAVRSPRPAPDPLPVARQPDLAAGSQYRPRWSVRSGAPIEQLSAKLKALLRKTRRAHQGRALAGDRPPPRRRAAKRVHPLP